jgi:hypothetical protein
MKWYEIVVAGGIAAVGGAVALFVALLALSPYLVILLAGFALLRYLGWF